jgi:hypothetical protein
VAETPLMMCGHAANSTIGASPACVICWPKPESLLVAVTVPDLAGRLAICGCGNTEPSRAGLAFFEYLGPGSRRAVTQCKHCRYSVEAHDPAVMARNKALTCTNFEPHGGFESDSFYCGHAGWD